MEDPRFYHIDNVSFVPATMPHNKDTLLVYAIDIPNFMGNTQEDWGTAISKIERYAKDNGYKRIAIYNNREYDSYMDGFGYGKSEIFRKSGHDYDKGRVDYLHSKKLKDRYMRKAKKYDPLQSISDIGPLKVTSDEKISHEGKQVGRYGNIKLATTPGGNRVLTVRGIRMDTGDIPKNIALYLKLMGQAKEFVDKTKGLQLEYGVMPDLGFDWNADKQFSKPLSKKLEKMGFKLGRNYRPKGFASLKRNIFGEERDAEAMTDTPTFKDSDHAFFRSATPKGKGYRPFFKKEFKSEFFEERSASMGGRFADGTTFKVDGDIVASEKFGSPVEASEIILDSTYDELLDMVGPINQEFSKSFWESLSHAGGYDFSKAGVVDRAEGFFSVVPDPEKGNEAIDMERMRAEGDTPIPTLSQGGYSALARIILSYMFGMPSMRETVEGGLSMEDLKLTFHEPLDPSYVI